MPLSRDLTHDEIVASSLRPNLEGYSRHLEPTVDNRTPGKFAISVGGNPHYVALFVNEDQ